MNALRPVRARLTLISILIIAAGLRFLGLDWDQGQHAHPDERWISMVAPSITWPQRVGDLLDPRRSTLNPLWVPDGLGEGDARSFSYGHLPLYLHSLVGHSMAHLGRELVKWRPAYRALGRELQSYGRYDGINLVGRLLSGLFDLGTIYLTYLLGRRVYDQRVGLLAAALTAVAVMHIQLSHFSTFDVITTFFVVLSLYGSVCVLQAKSTSIWPTVWGGAAAGLAVASKFSAIPLVAVLTVAQVLRSARHIDSADRAAIGKLIQRSWPSITLSLLVALLAFFLTSPFAVLDLRLYLKQIIEQGTMVTGTADWPFTRQYRNTIPYVYHIVQQVRWGLGWPLGIAAFGGFGWMALKQLRRPRAEELVLLGWAVPYFALTGAFMVKFMRYMLPLLPLFILMGAALLWRVREWARSRVTGSGPGLIVIRHVLHAVPYVVLATSALYALAFTRVYAQTHPWIQASRWIYAHVSDGSAIAREHWDDDLPMSLPEDRANPPAHAYDMSADLKLPMYESDDRAKYDQIRAILGRADYLVLATNRLYRTIPRLPERYPLSSEFYRLLFEEKLGYVREAEFTAYPGLLGLQVADDDADESFTVYDHPKPIVFRKERDLGKGEWSALFARALATEPVWPPQKKAGLLASQDRGPPREGEEKRSLLLDGPVGELPVVADAGWNRWASESTVGAVILWWLLVTALGWLAWPLAFALFSGLRDRGYLLSRSVALLVVGYLAWLPASQHWVKNGLPLTYAAIGVLVLVGALLLRRDQTRMVAFLRQKRGLLLLGEAVFGLAFLLFVGVRILNPDLWQPWNGGEKSMDIAYLNACLRSAYLPPYDPYYAGGYLNYYYYGQFLLSILTRLTGIQATVAFNLSVPLLFALTVSNAFSIGYTLVGKVRTAAADGPGSSSGARSGIGHGLLAALCVTVLGNLASATQVIERLGRLSKSAFTSQIPGLQSWVLAVSGVGQVLFHGAQLLGFNYWDPSRVVGFTINEFPYWSFLFADLHPHMVNLPFTLLVLALALNWLLRPRDVVGGGASSPAQEQGLGVAGALARPTTTAGLVWSSARTMWQRLDWGEVLNWVLWPVALGALAAINTWDFPAYAGFSSLMLVITFLRARGRSGLIPALVLSVVLAGASLLLYAPFFRYYTAIYVGFGWSLGRGHTELGEFLTVWGLFLFLSISLLVVLLQVQRSRWASLRLARLAARYLSRLPRVDELYALLVRRARPAYRLTMWGMVLAVGGMVWLAWKGYWVLVLMIPLLVWVCALLAQPKMPDGRRFVLALIFTAFLLLIGVELFYLKDHLAGDQMGWWRMNTLFKFYLQVWVMLGVAVGASLPGMWRAARQWRPAWRWPWSLLLAALLVAAALYPILGTPARVADRFPGERPPIGTLDGMAFMEVSTYSWPDDGNPIHLRGDYGAIRWLRENVPGTPVLAEAPIGYYREFGVRVSSYTGLPTLLGMHESEQRYGWQVGQRSAEARELFLTSDLQRTMDLIRDMGVRYVYVGPLERTEYPHTWGKFDQLATRGLLSIVYRNEQVTVFSVE